MVTLDGLVDELIEILRELSERENLVRAFQDAVLLEESESDEDSPGWDTLIDLATDFEFYQPDPEMRSSHHSLYGDDRLKELILAALKAMIDAGAIGPGVLTRAQRSV